MGACHSVKSIDSEMCGLNQVALVTTHTTLELLYARLHPVMLGGALVVTAAMPAKLHC